MQVYKFGGASIASYDRIQQLPNIVRKAGAEPLLIVVSAMGKTTNALEKVAEAFFAGKQDEALHLFEVVKQSHLNLAKQLLVTTYNATLPRLIDFFTEVEWLLHDQPVRSFDYYYDQIVCIGELLSTQLVSAYLTEVGIGNTWIDVRDLFRTDDTFREAVIDWPVTEEKVKSVIGPLLADAGIVLTQGFIGCTADNESTTLGREGSDYSAAVFANILNADAQTIWKDVPGVMNADPKLFSKAILMPELNYREVIEMSYYGAQVIHPKTIKPLQNKKIPLYVKSFLHPEDEGTRIVAQPVKGLPPVVVFKEKQVLLDIRSRDFSFIEGKPLRQLYELFEQLHIRPNLTQNGAISYLCVMDDRAEKVEELALAASAFFEVQLRRDIELLTIRHYDASIVEELIAGKTVFLKQETPETTQLLLNVG